MSTRRWQWAAVALTLVASLTWAFAPTSSSVSTSATRADTGQAVEVATSSEQLSLLQVEGLSVLPALLLPVAVVLVPLLVGVRYARLVALGCVVLLVLFVLAALFSIGAGYLPGLALAVVAVARGNPGRPASAGGHSAVADAAG